MTTIAPTLSPQLIAARDFLRVVFGQKPDDLYVLIWQFQGKRSHWFTSPDAAADRAVSLGQNSDVYVQTTLSPQNFGEYNRCAEKDAAGIVALIAELDFADPVHKKGNLPPTLDALLALVDSFPLAPTVVVLSAHGIHCWWCLKEPWVFEDEGERQAARDLNHRLQVTLREKAKAHGWTIDPTDDLARVLRVPGTFNHRGTVPVLVQTLRCDEARRYDPSDFEPYLLDCEPVVKPAVPSAVNGNSNGHEPKGLSGLVTLNDATFLASIQGFKNGPKFARLWDGNDTDCNGDTSAADLALCEILSFYTGKDRAKIDHYFRLSKRMRPKWDAKHYSDGRTYGQGTIDRAIELTTKTYSAGATEDEGDDDETGTTGEDVAEAAGPYPVALDVDLFRTNRDFILSCLREDEYGDAMVFARLYQGRVIYDHAEKAWHLWAGHYWQRDKTDAVKRLLAGQVASQYIHLAAELIREGRTEGDPLKEKEVQGKKLIDQARKLRKLNRVQNVLSFAASLLGVSGDEWDADPDLLGCPNGVVDLRTGAFRDGRPEDNIRTVTATPWTGLETPAPRWERFVAEILRRNRPASSQPSSEDTELVAYVQRLLGYGITGHTTDHVLPVFCGKDGRNGKDTLFETLGAVLGPLADAVSPDVLLGKKNPAGTADPHLYDLRGKRLTWASETNEGARFNVGQAKLVSGGGRIKTRPLYGNMVQFAATHLTILITNHRPHAPADDDAFWQRLQVVSFEQRFIDNPDPNKPNEHERDPDLKTALLAEASGILAWLVRGTLAWRERRIDPPKCVRLTTDRYRADEDMIALFIEHCCVVEAEREIQAEKLYRRYKEWTEGGGDTPMKMTTFGKKMTERFEKVRRDRGMCYIGIDVLAAPEPPTPLEGTQVPVTDDAGCRDVGSVGSEEDFSMEKASCIEKCLTDPTDYTSLQESGLNDTGKTVDEGAGAKGAFVPSADWQEIPEGYPCPPGGVFWMKLGAGKNWGRWPDLAPKERDDAAVRSDTLRLAEVLGWPELRFDLGTIVGTREYWSRVPGWDIRTVRSVLAALNQHLDNVMQPEASKR